MTNLDKALLDFTPVSCPAITDDGAIIVGNDAGVVKLVDALDSKSSSGDRVSVRFRPPAPPFF